MDVPPAAAADVECTTGQIRCNKTNISDCVMIVHSGPAVDVIY